MNKSSIYPLIALAIPQRVTIEAPRIHIEPPQSETSKQLALARARAKRKRKQLKQLEKEYGN